jgi:uncharacterized protein YgbK (DUF1537 family)
MLVAIADDITGAAEIAGIGLRYGLQVKLSTQALPVPACDLVVYATDTRAMSEREAVAETIRFARCITETHLFKKTDSALRGHIIPELKALMQVFHKTHACLLPQNPSKGRIIANGIYKINGIPLSETSFAYDPEYPAVTSCALNSLGLSGDESIRLAEASTEEEVVSVASRLTDDTLPAGGADFFAAFLQGKGYKEQAFGPFAGLGAADVLIVCGSTVKHTIADTPFVRHRKIPLCNIPEQAFLGNGDATTWLSELTPIYNRCRSLILSINQPPREGKAFAQRLRRLMAEVVIALMQQHLPQELIIEGGSTAYAILSSLNKTLFEVVDEIAPGVIRMHTEDGLFVTLKPGSYEWGNLFL